MNDEHSPTNKISSSKNKMKFMGILQELVRTFNAIYYIYVSLFSAVVYFLLDLLSGNGRESRRHSPPQLLVHEL